MRREESICSGLQTTGGRDGRFTLAAARAEIHHTGRRAHFAQSLLCQDGGNLVEFALVSAVFFAMVFGILQLCLALYTYDYISEAAREGSRWAIVRGSTSCTNTPNLTNCNASTTAISNFVKGLGYPGINATAHMTVTTTYWTWSGTAWTACTTGTCNAPGNAVQTQVSYALPLSVPYWRATTINLSSTSRMLISQ